MIHDTLMSEITQAIIRAEGGFKDALFWYEKVIQAEQAIVDSAETTEDDKAIARRGAENATRILTGLRALHDPAR